MTQRESKCWGEGFGCGMILMLVIMLVAGCQSTLAPGDAERIRQKANTMYLLSQLPMPPPEITFTKDRRFPHAAETDCRTGNITVSYYFAADRPDFVIDKVMPHEFAHIASCYYRGNTNGGVVGGEHDDFWKQWVVRLGGDPEYI